MPNLFSSIPSDLPEELCETILNTPNVCIERIVSKGHASPDGFWYDQTDGEWVVLVKGAARLRFEGAEPVELGPGDHINIPAHQRHRVEWTDPEQETVWLAVHYVVPK